MPDRQGGEGGEEKRGVGGLDVLVYVWGRLFEDERPEIGDLGDGFVPAGVQGCCEVYLLADCRRRAQLARKREETKERERERERK